MFGLLRTPPEGSRPTWC